MSKNLSHRNRKPGDTFERERDSSRQQEGLKFVSDEDIVGRSRDIRQVRFTERKDKEPKFVSDDDIVHRRAA